MALYDGLSGSKAMEYTRGYYSRNGKVNLALDKTVTEAGKKGSVSVKVLVDVYHRYFSEVDASEIQNILVKALGLYFKEKGE